MRSDLRSALRRGEVAAGRDGPGIRAAGDGRGRRSGNVGGFVASRLGRRQPMKTGLWLLAVGLLHVAPAFAALMPMPQTLVPGAGSLKIDSSFSVQAHGYSDARLDRAMRRLVARISRQTGIEMRAGKTVLSIECSAGGPQYPALGEDESYRMDVSADGARISAATVSGALRGMETFAEWIDLGRNGFEARAVHIDDAPRFPWRGLMLDVSRHWMPVPVVLR